MKTLNSLFNDCKNIFCELISSNSRLFTVFTKTKLTSKYQPICNNIALLGA